MLEQVKEWYPDEDLRASMKDVFSLLDQLLWQVAVAEKMRSRPELHALRPILGHAIIRLPFKEAELWVKATAANHFTVERVIYQGNGHYDCEFLNEGDADQATVSVVKFLQSSRMKWYAV